MAKRGPADESLLVQHLFQGQLAHLTKELTGMIDDQAKHISDLRAQVEKTQRDNAELLEECNRLQKDYDTKYRHCERQISAFRDTTEALRDHHNGLSSWLPKKLDQHETDQTRQRKETEAMAAMIGKWKVALEHTITGMRSSIADHQTMITKLESQAQTASRVTEIDEAETDQVRQEISKKADTDDTIEVTGLEVVHKPSVQPGFPHQVVVDVYIAPQGIKSNEAQLEHLQSTIPIDCVETGRYLASEYVKAAVKTFKDADVRNSLMVIMEAKEWCWEAFLEEVPRILEEAAVRAREAHTKAHEERVKAQEEKARGQEEKAKVQEADARAQKARIKAHEANVKAPEPMVLEKPQKKPPRRSDRKRKR